MTIEEAGPDPVRIAAAVHAQLGGQRIDTGATARASIGMGGGTSGPAPRSSGGQKSCAVPVEAIAAALDIVEIRVEPLKSLEGALLFPANRNVGAVVINRASSPERRRYTLAHELGHFLNLLHKPAGASGSFACARADLAKGWRPPGAIDRRLEQEIEANRFAIEFLAPRHLMRRHLHGIPDLARVVAAADALGLSRAAAARRYVELHDATCAVAFSQNGVLRYAEWTSSFPPLRLRKGDPLPPLPRVRDARGLSDHEDADPRDWLLRPRRQNLVVQVLAQRDGYATVMLAVEDDDGGDGSDARSRLGRRGDI